MHPWNMVDMKEFFSFLILWPTLSLKACCNVPGGSSLFSFWILSATQKYRNPDKTETSWFFCWQVFVSYAERCFMQMVRFQKQRIVPMCLPSCFECGGSCCICALSVEVNPGCSHCTGECVGSPRPAAVMLADRRGRWGPCCVTGKVSESSVLPSAPINWACAYCVLIWCGKQFILAWYCWCLPG